MTDPAIYNSLPYRVAWRVLKVPLIIKRIWISFICS